MNAVRRITVTTALLAGLALTGCTGDDPEPGASSSSQAQDAGTETATSAGTSQAASQSSSPSSTSSVAPTSSPTSTGTAGPGSPELSAEGRASFATPSGNITCAMSSDGVRCDVVDPTFSVPEADKAGCDLDIGDSLSVDRDGAALTCHGDTIRGTARKGSDETTWWKPEHGTAPDGSAALPYGASLKVGDFLCTSEKSGVTCLYVGNGDSFLVAKERYEVTNQGH